MPTGLANWSPCWVNREMIVNEVLHQDEVNMMLRRLGDTAAFKG